MPNILCIGDICIDYYIDQSIKVWGGCSLNNYVQLLELGLGPKIISIVNDNDFQKLSENIKILGSIQQSELPSPLQKISVDEHGERHLLEYQSNCFQSLKLNELELQMIEDADIIYFSLFEQSKTILKQVPEKHLSKFIIDFQSMEDFDYALESIDYYLDKINFACFGLSLDKRHKKLNENIVRFYKNHSIPCLITTGAEAVRFIHNDLFEFNVNKTKVIDSTGAGDCFLVHFSINYLLKNMSASDSFKIAQANVQSVLQRIGSTAFQYK